MQLFQPASLLVLLFTALAKRNLPLSETHRSLSELNQYPITGLAGEMAERSRTNNLID